MWQHGKLIDSLEFARLQGELSGHLKPSELPRLADVLFDSDCKLDYQISGESVSKVLGGEHALVVSINGKLRLVCQRCLGALDYTLKIRRRLVLVRGGRWPDESLEDDDSDAIEASGEMNVVQLLEEEILLALPLAPMHKDCAIPSNSAASNKESPFAKLAQLKNK